MRQRDERKQLLGEYDIKAQSLKEGGRCKGAGSPRTGRPPCIHIRPSHMVYVQIWSSFCPRGIWYTRAVIAVTAEERDGTERVTVCGRMNCLERCIGALLGT